jgi:hypothetical protein
MGIDARICFDQWKVGTPGLPGCTDQDGERLKTRLEDLQRVYHVTSIIDRGCENGKIELRRDGGKQRESPSLCGSNPGLLYKYASFGANHPR